MDLAIVSDWLFHSNSSDLRFKWSTNPTAVGNTSESIQVLRPESYVYDEKTIVWTSEMSICEGRGDWRESQSINSR